jgi:hypothetical protein
MSLDMNMQIIKISRVSGDEKMEMFNLINSYFSNFQIETFLKDISEKDWVIVLREPGEKIFGFSTIQVIPAAVDGREVIYVFSGDTIVDPQYWQANMLAPAFGFFMLRMIDDYKELPVYWFLITKGYRTYRFLPMYFRKYYPAWNKETPPEYDRLLKYICTGKFGKWYNPGTGVITFNGAKDHLNDQMCEIPESKKQNSHIKFFLEKNPYYYRGDELACIADISRENLNKLAYRIMEEKSVQWIE